MWTCAAHKNLSLWHDRHQTGTIAEKHFFNTPKIDWDASNYASGVYLYKLTAGNFTDTKKMVLLK